MKQLLVAKCVSRDVREDECFIYNDSSINDLPTTSRANDESTQISLLGVDVLKKFTQF